jgi:hypothetical protein
MMMMVDDGLWSTGILRVLCCFCFCFCFVERAFLLSLLLVLIFVRGFLVGAAGGGKLVDDSFDFNFRKRRTDDRLTEFGRTDDEGDPKKWIQNKSAHTIDRSFVVMTLMTYSTQRTKDERKVNHQPSTINHQPWSEVGSIDGIIRERRPLTVRDNAVGRLSACQLNYAAVLCRLVCRRLTLRLTPTMRA